MLPETLPTALKEWKLVADALADGRQVLLLRKGGIYESGGEFELENRRFVFFPTYIHQNLGMLKPTAQAGFEARSTEPTKVVLTGRSSCFCSWSSFQTVSSISDTPWCDAPEIAYTFFSGKAARSFASASPSSVARSNLLAATSSRFSASFGLNASSSRRIVR